MSNSKNEKDIRQLIHDMSSTIEKLAAQHTSFETYHERIDKKLDNSYLSNTTTQEMNKLKNAVSTDTSNMLRIIQDLNQFHTTNRNESKVSQEIGQKECMDPRLDSVKNEQDVLKRRTDQLLELINSKDHFGINPKLELINSWLGSHSQRLNNVESRVIHTPGKESPSPEVRREEFMNLKNLVDGLKDVDTSVSQRLGAVENRYMNSTEKESLPQAVRREEFLNLKNVVDSLKDVDHSASQRSTILERQYTNSTAKDSKSSTVGREEFLNLKSVVDGQVILLGAISNHGANEKDILSLKKEQNTLRKDLTDLKQLVKQEGTNTYAIMNAFDIKLKQRPAAVGILDKRNSSLPLDNETRLSRQIDKHLGDGHSMIDRLSTIENDLNTTKETSYRCMKRIKGIDDYLLKLSSSVNGLAIKPPEKIPVTIGPNRNQVPWPVPKHDDKDKNLYLHEGDIPKHANVSFGADVDLKLIDDKPTALNRDMKDSKAYEQGDVSNNVCHNLLTNTAR